MHLREIICEASAIRSLPKYDTRQMKAVQQFPRPQLSDRHRKAVIWWRDGGYHDINATLRDVPPETSPYTTADMQRDYGFVIDRDEAIAQLDDLISQAPKRKKTIHVFRGERSAEHRKTLVDMAIGDSYVDPGYVATSFGPSYAFYAFTSAKGPLSMILVPPAVKGAYVADQEHTEMEFLINRGTRFTLLDKRTIPNKNRGFEELLLLVWRAGNEP